MDCVTSLSRPCATAAAFRRYSLAELAIVTRAAPIMIASFTTNRPAPESSGTPCSVLPNDGTQHSGVVIKNDSVTNDIANTRKLPRAATRGNHGWSAIITPYTTITLPSPYANAYVPFC